MSSTALCMAVLLAACAVETSDAGITVTQARIGAPTGPNAALYMVIQAGDGDDRLISAETEVANAVELHETTASQDGATGMRAVDGLDLPAGSDLVLEPGGHHLMLIDVEPLGVGQTVDVTLVWETAGSMTVVAEVVDPADTMEDDP